nr:hypothetical protein [Candidatus Sigynarchaeota archaeon]
MPRQHGKVCSVTGAAPNSSNDRCRRSGPVAMLTLDFLRSVAGCPRVEGRMIGSPCKDRADPGERVYFEATDPVSAKLRRSGIPSGKKIVCRAYRGDMGIITGGIEMFMDAEFDGDQPDFNYPATSTCPGVSAIRDVYNAASTPTKARKAYVQYLANHRRIKTNIPGVFFGHYTSS